MEMGGHGVSVVAMMALHEKVKQQRKETKRNQLSKSDGSTTRGGGTLQNDDMDASAFPALSWEQRNRIKERKNAIDKEVEEEEEVPTRNIWLDRVLLQDSKKRRSEKQKRDGDNSSRNEEAIGKKEEEGNKSTELEGEKNENGILDTVEKIKDDVGENEEYEEDDFEED